MTAEAAPSAIEDAELARRIARLDRMARTMDSRFRIPGTNLRFGWDSILGLIPGAGDLITVVPSAYMIYEGARMGARKSVLARMGANSAIDLVVGGIPLAGDVFDLFFKSHRRNAALLNDEARRLQATRRKMPEGFAGSRASQPAE